MSTRPTDGHDHEGRRERRLQERELARLAADRRRHRAATRQAGHLRTLGFGVTVVAVLAVGAVLAFGDFANRPGSAGGAISIQSSMAGFTPSEIRVTAGETVTLNWWTDDSALHLENGVHTMIAPELDLYEELAAEAIRTVVWQVPDRPGTYDVYCDTCCGGKGSPSMHGTIVIEPSA
jgi:cytochrome c oxidase subunit II